MRRPPSRSTLFPYTTLFRSLRVEVEDLEPVVGRVHRVEVRAVGRERERADLTGLEGDEGRAGRDTAREERDEREADRKSTRLNSSHQIISYAVFCLKKKTAE